MMNNEIYGYSILVVEDENILRKDYVMYLEMMFQSVYESTNGEEAYSIYKEKKPDILIVDINIPKLNGLELLEKIRKNDPITKAIILTAYKDNDFLYKATSLKLTQYLVKPISRKVLKLALNKVIDELENFTITAIKNKILGDGYIWNYDKKELTSKGKIIYLTNKEKMVFKLFMDNLDSVLSVDTILYSVWNSSIEVNNNTLKTMLKKLRKKLPSDTIKNIHGVGYTISS